MNSITVETTGNFMLIDRFSGKTIPETGTATVPVTPFIQERLDNGDLRLLDGEIDPDLQRLIAAANAGGQGVDLGKLEDEEIIETLSTPPAPVQEQPAPTEPETTSAAPARDQDGDGHDDRTGQFVEDNQEAAGPRRRRGGNA